MDKQIVESLEKSVAQLTETLKEKFDKYGELNSDVIDLKSKFADLVKEYQDKKHQFQVDMSKSANIDKTELDTRMDELFIAKALCHNVETKKFDEAAFNKIKALPVYADAIKAFGDVSAMQTGTAGYGAEWIPEGFSSSLEKEIWLGLKVGALFRRIPMPFSTYTLPFDPKRMIAKRTTEGGTVTKVRGQTSNIVFNAQKLMGIVELTDEADQDSIVPALNFLRGQLIDSFVLAQESVCINGDKSTNNALLYPAGALGAEDCRGIANGIRYDALNGSGANCKASLASGGITDTSLRTIRANMGKYGITPSDLAYVMTITDYFKCLNFTGYQSLQQVGAKAVVLQGQLGSLDGVPIVVTELMPEAGVTTDAADALGGLNASGVWDNSTKSKGSVLVVNTKGYMWGDRKEFTLELFRNPFNGTTNLIGTERLDFEKVASATAKTCSVGYNY